MYGNLFALQSAAASPSLAPWKNPETGWNMRQAPRRTGSPGRQLNTRAGVPSLA